MQSNINLFTYIGILRGTFLSIGMIGLLLTWMSKARYFLRDGDFNCSRELLLRIPYRFGGESSAPSSWEIFGNSQLNIRKHNQLVSLCIRTPMAEDIWNEYKPFFIRVVHFIVNAIDHAHRKDVVQIIVRVIILKRYIHLGVILVLW